MGKLRSAALPDRNHLLLSPLHPDAGKLRIVNVQDVPFDPQLFKPVS